MESQHVRIRTADARDVNGLSDAPATRNPFLHPSFLAASIHHGPGEGTAVVAEVDAGGDAPVRWGWVERSKLGFRGAVAWDGPEFPEGADRAVAWERLLEALDARGNAILRMQDCTTVRLAPEDVKAAEAAALRHRWKVSPGVVGTFALDLTRSEEDLEMAMSQSHRRNVRKATKAGLQLERLEGATLDDYLRIQDATYERKGLDGWPHDYLRGLFEIPTHFRAYGARAPDGDMVAVALIALDGETGVYLHGGSGHRTLRGAGQWIQWHVSRDLAAEGYRRYDFGGVDLTPEGELTDGIDAFKGAFGGDLLKNPCMEVELAPLKNRLLQKGMNLARKFGE